MLRKHFTTKWSQNGRRKPQTAECVMRSVGSDMDTGTPSECPSRLWLSHGLRASGQKNARWASAEGHFARLCQSSSCVFWDRAADTGPAADLMPFHSPAPISAYNSQSPAISLRFRKKHRSVTPRMCAMLMEMELWTLTGFQVQSFVTSSDKDADNKGLVWSHHILTNCRL